MSANVLFGPPWPTLEVLLDDPREHDFPAVTRILGDVTPEQAVIVGPGLRYSIAQIVARMLANIHFNLELIQADDPARYENPHEMWPNVTVEQWPSLVAGFLATLESLKRVAMEEQELARVLCPATEDEAAWTVGYKLVGSVAKHNAYHLGQIVMLRRLIGAWRDETQRT